MAVFGSGFVTIGKTWVSLKDIATRKTLAIQYDDQPDVYQIFAIDANVAYVATIFKSEVPYSSLGDYSQEQNDADKTEFETSYKNQSNSAIHKRDTEGRSISVSEPRVGDEVIVVTHNFCDKCSWYGDSIRVTDVILTGSVDHLSFSSGIPYWIDMASGRVLNDDGEVDRQRTENPGDPHGWQVVVKVDGIAATMREPFQPSGGDYEVIYENGSVNFFEPVTGSVAASFSYAAGSTWYLTPVAGTVVKVEAAEADFSNDIVMNDSIEYSFWGYAAAFAPEYVEAGALQPTDRVKLKAKLYKRYQQILQEAIGTYPVIPPNAATQEHAALELNEFRRRSRGAKGQSISVPFRYGTINEIPASYGVQMRVRLVHDQAYDGECATTTFYCTSNSE